LQPVGAVAAVVQAAVINKAVAAVVQAAVINKGTFTHNYQQCF